MHYGEAAAEVNKEEEEKSEDGRGRGCSCGAATGQLVHREAG
jgi:hypothetical protein